jgi:hypothetical protein
MTRPLFRVDREEYGHRHSVVINRPFPHQIEYFITIKALQLFELQASQNDSDMVPNRCTLLKVLARAPFDRKTADRACLWEATAN